VSSTLYSIETGSSAQTVAKMLRVLFPDAMTVLDMTYGSGKFWTPHAPWRVTGMDLDPERARDVCADFTRLPFMDGAFDVCIFDPPYLAGCSPKSRMGNRFSSFRNLRELREAVMRGAAEARRAGSIGTIVKVQNYSQSHRNVRMTKWIEDVMGEEPYGEVHAMNSVKMIGSHWGQQLSVYSIHTTYLAFRHGSQIHARRAQVLDDPVAVEQPQQIDLFGEVAG
jgi:hypothetical protein